MYVRLYVCTWQCCYSSLAEKQKQFLGVWRNYRSPGEAHNEEVEKETASSDKEKVINHDMWNL